MSKPSSAKREHMPSLCFSSVAVFGPCQTLVHCITSSKSPEDTRMTLVHAMCLQAQTCASLIVYSAACRADWNREKAMHSNYASNQFQSDPNEGFGRNAAPKKVGGNPGPLQFLISRWRLMPACCARSGGCHLPLGPHMAA